jgi:hypothetical protein
MKQIDPERLAARLRTWLDQGGGLEAILEIGAEFTALADRAMEMARRGQHDEAARCLARDLRSALTPVMDATPWLADVLTVVNRNAPDTAKTEALERLVGKQASEERIAEFLESVAIGHETGKRHACAVFRYGVNSERFRKWLDTRQRERRMAFNLDEYPRAREPRSAEVPTDTTTVEDLAVALADTTAGGRALAELLAAGKSLGAAARQLGLSEQAVRQLHSRLRRGCG